MQHVVIIFCWKLKLEKGPILQKMHSSVNIDHVASITDELMCVCVCVLCVWCPLLTREASSSLYDGTPLQPSYMFNNNP